MSKNIKLNMSRRIRRTPYTNRVEQHGVSDFTVVNHMLLPKGFKNTVEEDYLHLSKEVQMWDVSCQRQVQICGPDAAKLIQKLTPRSIKDMTIGKCFYIPMLNENAGMINDPVLLKLDDDMFWISIADSDILLWAKGLALGLNLNVVIEEPDVYPLAIQGPKSEELMVSIFGDEIKKIKFFNFRVIDFEGTKQIIARSGYSKQDGFEIYFKVHENYFDKVEMGEKLWDTIWEAGKKFNISPGCPNLIDRIEAGLMSYGNDFTGENNPLECNLEKYCKADASHDFVGKQALTKIQSEGIIQKMRGIIFDGAPCAATGQPLKIFSKDNKRIGQITSGIFSPRIKKNIGLSMILKDYWNVGNEVIIETLDGEKRNGTITSLPFPD
ncbi:probable aminomethyltransferase, putative [Candidatus Pelagibacter sp. HTCC7211]|uniref:dimethylsulfoniopropionate demethylase n=1 Tax=Pelagibacter sp. (strain HTCC7211) TaxID=439493 RepID=UPI000183BAB0|nr:dimethylsulfoniopropionate demethylase [Candidatus Pelagibacter sp. HTCC7211]EDZ61098.1 probable aminomethyltransferase, putative [Candidatus Pelagibacter sp. HTCC7211]MBD1151653.1 dimethylsulfoniopropionate demethylase [Pelagibacterales bacterium SAG-MED25]